MSFDERQAGSAPALNYEKSSNRLQESQEESWNNRSQQQIQNELTVVGYDESGQEIEMP